MHNIRIEEMLADTALDMVSEFGKGCIVLFVILQYCNCWLIKVHFRFCKEILEWNGNWDLESHWSMICIKSVQDFLCFTTFYCYVMILVRGCFCLLPLSFRFCIKKKRRAGKEKRGSLIGPIMKIILKDRELKWWWSACEVISRVNSALHHNGRKINFFVFTKFKSKYMPWTCKIRNANLGYK